MKKLINILLLLCIALGMTACQQKTIVATINYKNGEKESGMSAELKENSTVKDLFDAFGKGEEFVYQVDSDGYIEAINGLGNNEDGYWEILLNGFTPDDVIAKTVLKDNDVVDVTYIPNTESAVTIVGGWETAEVAREELTDEEKEMFTTAVQDLLGETYEPVCVLATQLVSGTNYAYLARGTVLSASSASSRSIRILKATSNLKGSKISMSQTSQPAQTLMNRSSAAGKYKVPANRAALVPRKHRQAMIRQWPITPAFLTIRSSFWLHSLSTAQTMSL